MSAKAAEIWLGAHGPSAGDGWLHEGDLPPGSDFQSPLHSLGLSEILHPVDWQDDYSRRTFFSLHRVVPLQQVRGSVLTAGNRDGQAVSERIGELLAQSGPDQTLADAAHRVCRGRAGAGISPEEFTAEVIAALPRLLATGAIYLEPVDFGLASHRELPLPELNLTGEYLSDTGCFAVGYLAGRSGAERVRIGSDHRPFINEDAYRTWLFAHGVPRLRGFSFSTRSVQAHAGRAGVAYPEPVLRRLTEAGLVAAPLPGELKSFAAKHRLRGLMVGLDSDRRGRRTLGLDGSKPVLRLTAEQLAVWVHAPAELNLLRAFAALQLGSTAAARFDLLKFMRTVQELVAVGAAYIDRAE